MKISQEDARWIRTNIEYHLKNTIMDMNLEIVLKKIKEKLRYRK